MHRYDEITEKELQRILGPSVKVTVEGTKNNTKCIYLQANDEVIRIKKTESYNENIRLERLVQDEHVPFWSLSCYLDVPLGSLKEISTEVYKEEDLEEAKRNLADRCGKLLEDVAVVKGIKRVPLGMAHDPEALASVSNDDDIPF